MNKALAVASLVARINARQLSTTSVNLVKPDMSKIKAAQTKFQQNMDTPVYLQGGPLDKALYYFTIGVTVVVTYFTVETMIKQIKK